MATLGSKDIADISKDELLRAYAAAGNKNAQQMLAGASPTPSTQSLGSRDIKDISKEEIIDAYAKSGTGTSQQKAKEIQANSYALPSYKPAGTQPSGTPLADATEALLPEAENRSSLVEFADLLNQATTLARDRRQASELGILEDYGFKPGQVRAATMGSVLNLLQQRTDTSHGALQEAAMQAYEDETERQATDLANKQQLALQLIGKVDEATLNGILNAPDFNSAMAMSAGALKGAGQYSDVRTATVDGKLAFFGVKDDGTVEQLAQFGEGGTTPTGYAPTSDMKEYEYAVSQGFTGSFQEWKAGSDGPDKNKLRKQEFDLAVEYASSFQGTDKELELELRRDSDVLSDSDIRSITSQRKMPDVQIKSHAVSLVQEYLDDGEGINFGINSWQLADAKRAALKDIQENVQEIGGRELEDGGEEEKRLIAAINAITENDVTVK